MIERLQKMLKSKLDYDLKEYALYEIKREMSKLVIGSLIVFMIFVVLFILDTSGTFASFMNLGILIFVFFVFVLVPLALKKGSKHDAIIVTPDLLIQRTSKTDFSIIRFNDIERFLVTKEGIAIKDKKSTVLLGLDLFREEIDPIIDILEAKGKTFDPEKEYMIREILVKIEDNEIIIIDIEKDEFSAKLYEKYNKDYEMLTPGFINEIIFRNSMVDSTSVNGDNIAFTLNGFEVKGGHPENTTFGTITVEDCILLFRDVTLKQLLLQNLNSKDKKDEELPLEIESFPQYLENAVISHWKSSGKDIDLYFATGVNILKTSFSFKEVIIGWNKTK